MLEEHQAPWGTTLAVLVALEDFQLLMPLGLLVLPEVQEAEVGEASALTPRLAWLMGVPAAPD
jgi:hypothetical protein